ncbi:MAG: polymer-forming cytoskeletal protein [Verrucomicrobiota bacterium]|nr:polymer-forming cytoskeletal protein [Verrucomicrobiota bacterium]
MECPHCGFQQQDYAAAKSTICRQCGKHFSPTAPRVEIKLQGRREEVAPAEPPRFAGAASALRGRIEGLWAKPRSGTIDCFDCTATQDVNWAATSTSCRKCGAHQDLRDYKVTTAFSRAIRTHGEVHITPRGDVTSSSVVCRTALIEGKMRGNLQCSETVRVNLAGKIPGRMKAVHVIVERRAEVQFFRQLRTKSIEIDGRMTGDIIAEGLVTIRRTGALDGNVTAKSISVEKGGVFSGQLVIGTVGLEQAELLPQASAPAVGETIPMLIPPPLPAT